MGGNGNIIGCTQQQGSLIQVCFVIGCIPIRDVSLSILSKCQEHIENNVNSSQHSPSEKAGLTNMQVATGVHRRGGDIVLGLNFRSL